MRDELNQIDVCFVVDTTGSMSPFLSDKLGITRRQAATSLARLGRRKLLQ